MAPTTERYSYAPSGELEDVAFHAGENFRRPRDVRCARTRGTPMPRPHASSKAFAEGAPVKASVRVACESTGAERDLRRMAVITVKPAAGGS
jgi:hypothetical protein